MEMIRDHLLTVLTFLPLAGAALVLLVPGDRPDVARRVALLVSLATFALSVPLYLEFDRAVATMQFVERVPWIPSLGVSYHVGIDGISLFMVLLTTFLTPLVILGSFSSPERRVGGYMAGMLALETGMLGVFVALDLFLFYVFWEAMLIPMYFIIGIWGGERRVYAAVKFFLYTMLGSVLMLVALIALAFMFYRETGMLTFDLVQIDAYTVPVRAQMWLFAAFAIAFAIKVPMFPFHTWLPDAHVEAPTGGSVILAGVLLKMGTYGFLRFAMPLFPVAAEYAAPWVMLFAVVGIIYGALVAMVQEDVKKLVAYSSVSHLGYCMLGIFALNVTAVQGGLLQMINHGLSTGALFLLVGVLYERRHTRRIDAFGGLAKTIPLFSVVFMIVTLSSIGLPGLNGFVGEILVLIGAFQADKVLTALAATGMVLGAVYMLWMFQRVVFGTVTDPHNRDLPDMSAREFATLAPLLAGIVILGVYPNAVLAPMEPSVARFVETVEAKRAASLAAPDRFALWREEGDGRLALILEEDAR